MNKEDIKKEWESFIEFPSSDKSTVTSTSSLLFAQHIAEASRKAALSDAADLCQQATPVLFTVLNIEKEIRRLRDE